MRTKSRIGWCTLNSRVVTALAALCLGWTVWGGEGPGPDQVREEARRLEDRARDLLAAGQGAEAENLMGEARELRAKLERMAPPGEERPAVAKRTRELQQQMDELRLVLKRKIDEGREAEADELREQMERLQRELRAASGRGGETEFRRRDTPTLAGRPEARDAARRLEHLQRAVENLRAGGMPEIAARLEQEGQRIRERLKHGGPRGVPLREIERLRDEVRELHQAMREMKRRLEEVARRQPQIERRGDR